MPLVDADGDGLDDLLEMRLGTAGDMADTDADGWSDLQEIMSGCDPLVANPSQSFPNPDTSLYFNLYAMGNDCVLEVYAQNHSGVATFGMVRALEQNMVTYQGWDLANFLVDQVALPTTDPQWTIDRARFLIPTQWLIQQGTISIAAQVVMDQAVLAHAVTLCEVNGVLAQWVPVNLFAVSTPNTAITASQFGSAGGGHGNVGSNGSGASGGLFPVEPSGDGPPQSGSSDQVCLQVLQPIAYLGSGRVAYQVSDAYCDPLAGAVCLVGCAATLGDTIIGIDIVGLLGG